jgi:hypothetical protein
LIHLLPLLSFLLPLLMLGMLLLLLSLLLLLAAILRRTILLPIRARPLPEARQGQRSANFQRCQPFPDLCSLPH